MQVKEEKHAVIKRMHLIYKPEVKNRKLFCKMHTDKIKIKITEGKTVLLREELSSIKWERETNHMHIFS